MMYKVVIIALASATLAAVLTGMMYRSAQGRLQKLAARLSEQAAFWQNETERTSRLVDETRTSRDIWRALAMNGRQARRDADQPLAVARLNGRDTGLFNTIERERGRW